MLPSPVPGLWAWSHNYGEISHPLLTGRLLAKSWWKLPRRHGRSYSHTMWKATTQYSWSSSSSYTYNRQVVFWISETGRFGGEHTRQTATSTKTPESALVFPYAHQHLTITYIAGLCAFEISPYWHTHPSSFCSNWQLFPCSNIISTHQNNEFYQSSLLFLVCI